MIMKRLNSLLLAALMVLVLAAGQAYAQEEITDEDLKTYAVMDMAVSSITSTISPMVNELIEKQEGMDGNRFQELQGAMGNDSKLQAVEAKDWELQFMDVVNKQIEKKKEAATDVLKLMASNALGAAKYKEIKSGLASDASLKSRYDAIVDKCK
jgi:hypothetical protein